jgi:hypothetical protein
MPKHVLRTNLSEVVEDVANRVPLTRVFFGSVCMGKQTQQVNR